MDRFGPQWEGHAEKIRDACAEVVEPDDLLLIPGDLSWAMRLDAAQTDLDFLGDLPGTKVVVRGNHDYWWQSITKVRAALPESIHALAGDALAIGDIHLCGTRLWDVPGAKFGHLIAWLSEEDGGVSRPPQGEEERARAEKIYTRERGRLTRALDALDNLPGEPRLRMVLLHYPPCEAELTANELTEMFEARDIDHVVFGHMHSIQAERQGTLFGEHNGVSYHLTSCDYLDFRPIRIA